MCKMITQFFKDESGVTAIEYGIIAAGISIVIVFAVQQAGTNLSGTFTTIAGIL